MQNTTEINEVLTGGLSWSFIIVFVIFSVLGQLISLLLHYHRKKKDKKHKFNFRFWISDNAARIILGIIIPFCVAVLFPDLKFAFKWVFDKFGAPYELNTAIGLFLGLFMDSVIIVLRNKSKINIFQK